MSGKKWMDVNWLLDPDVLHQFYAELAEDDKTRVVRKPQAAPTAALHQAAPAAPPPSPSLSWAPMPKMGEVPAAEPALAARTRPDLPSAQQRHQDFSNAYADPNATNKSLKRLNKGSLNIAFHGKMNNGHQYLAKPDAGIAFRDKAGLDQDTLQALNNDAPGNANRHNAAYELMSAMGAHHMVSPGMAANMHARHQFKGNDPSAGDSEEKRFSSAAAHAGGAAHVQEFIPGLTNSGKASQADRDKVDSEHRVHGLVGHLLTGAQDGSAQNVMLHPSGHPILIDHDMGLNSSQAAANREHYGKDAFRSAFSPGAPMDYQSKLPKDANGKAIPVGTNFPPRMKETLERAAEGYFSKGHGNLGLSPEDSAVLQKNARELLSYGVEGVLARRHDMDAEYNATEAAKSKKGS